ncbi:hypothetical protein M378DRAFT_166319 [Amanita muscaria Koide BX008]|uniref:Uncharacterized protein n=1 Tax=Amanita muscaria (strain Koide BX008) TaxID=946122 RepID=A0A0C2WYQ9_AMAMK|nr:hypothetical protein M378DRAFT_166319 [Amanita muscaria Koide BX008]
MPHRKWSHRVTRQNVGIDDSVAPNESSYEVHLGEIKVSDQETKDATSMTIHRS